VADRAKIRETGRQALLEPIKFNVIIPTRERCDTLRHALRTVVEQRYANLSIIVSDNFSRDQTRAVVDSFADDRITYVNTGRRVSMSHNWEFALGHVTDGWVTFLGDDDGMLPGALARIAQVIEATQTRAVVSQWRFYFWPNSTGNANRLTIPCSNGYDVRESGRWLARLMEGATDYHELPYVYTGGFVDSQLINEARHEDGTFFCSMTPDVYSAIAIASMTESYVMLHEPACVMGVSSHSNGASNLSPDGPSGPGDLYYSEENIPFHPMLGAARVKSIPIIVYECYLQSMHLHKDRLQVGLSDQLALALAKAAADYRSALTEYCAQVISRNPERSASLPSRRKLATMRLKHWIRGIAGMHRQLDNLTVMATAYHVRDVHGAALLTSYLHRFDQNGRNWRAKKLITYLAKCLGLKKTA
jgi:hypothetical protein